MSVASKNPFALLDAEDASRPSSPVSKSAPNQAPSAAAPARGSQRGRAGPASRGGRYYPRGGKSGPREETQDAGDDAAGGDDQKRRFDGEGRGRGRGRGRGGDRGGRGGRGRPFDKHSQTGKTDSDKKLHQGWGGDEGGTELKAEDAAANDAAAESFSTPAVDAGDWGISADVTDNWGTPAPPTGDVAPPEGEKTGEREARRGRDREPEEEDNTLTFDEYLKQQKELEIVPKLEVRKANEGDDSIWKDAVPVTKKEEEEAAYFVGKTKNAPKVRAKKDEKVYLEIDARFERPQRGGRGRGGDRGDRGGRERGRGRGAGRGRANGNGNVTSVLDVDDQAAFPSLA
ncbi:hypothetical protein B0H21DRAFT_742532 [Amylocystis lapponica]|nr:hypothetical protein B0H21DRAFT_742532 [Amylocystis lapponica]